MNNESEPSLLDYLKAKFNPFSKGTIEIPENEEEEIENDDDELVISEFYQSTKYEKSTGVFERIEFRITETVNGNITERLDYVIQRQGGGSGNGLGDLPGAILGGGSGIQQQMAAQIQGFDSNKNLTKNSQGINQLIYYYWTKTQNL